MLPHVPSALLLACLAGLAAAAPLAPRAATRARVCELIHGEADASFARYGLSGSTTCRCVSAASAECEPLTPYPTTAPGSADAALAAFHRPQVSASEQQALHAHQIQVQCYYQALSGRRCAVTWPASGKSAPVCDCALADGVAGLRRPYYVDRIGSRRTQDPARFYLGAV